MLEVSKDNFTSEVLEAGKPVVLDFWGPSCQPCLQLMPDVEALAEIYKEKIIIAKVNSTQNRRLCIDLKVMGLPSFLVFKNGAEVKRISGGELTRQDIENLILEQVG